MKTPTPLPTTDPAPVESNGTGAPSPAPVPSPPATERKWVLPSGGRVIVPYSIVEGGTVTGTDAIVGDIQVTAGMDVEALLTAKVAEACEMLAKMQRGEA